MITNIIDINDPMEVISVSFKTCKICKKSFSTASEYKIHIKEHKKVCKIFYML